MNRDLASLDNPRVNTHATIGDGGTTLRRRLRRRRLDTGARLRWCVRGQRADGGQKSAEWIFGIDPALKRPALGCQHVLLLDGQRQPRSRAEHELDQVETSDLFGHRMLYLKPCVHLEEVVTLLAVDKVLNGASGGVADGLCELNRFLAHLTNDLVGQVDCRRLLYNLLVTALDTAFARRQIDAVAMLVGDQLCA